MSLFGAIASGFQAKAIDASSLTWQRLLGTDPAKSGVSVNTNTALKVSTVMACARVLANGVATPPLRLYREGPDGSKTVQKDHPLHKVLWRQPNEWMTSFEFRQVMMFHAVIHGNAYAYIGRGGSPRRVMEIVPLVPERVCVVQNDDYSLVYEVSDSNGGRVQFPRSEIFHLRGPSWNGYAGMDAIQNAREAIGLAIATEESHSRLHSNGAKPGGLLSVEGTLTKVARDALKEGLAQKYEGLQNAFKTLVLDQNAKWTPFAMSGVDAQHLDTRRFQIEEICRDLGVFPQMVMHTTSTSTFASAEAFFQAHVTHTLQPWVENWQQSIARDLISEPDLYAEFSLQSLLRGDHAARAAFYASGIQNGWLNRNEARHLENLNKADGLDEFFSPLNMGSAPEPEDEGKARERKIGRVLSAANERRIATARDELDVVLTSLSPKDGDA